MADISLETANQMIPLLRSIAKEIMQLWQEIGAVQYVLDVNEEISSEERDTMTADIQEKVDRLTEVLDEVEELGCMIDSYDEGIIDIPSIIDGREVLLCWKYAEDKIKYYHSLDETYEQRILIDAIVE